eukprot:TRINITY_DN6583_c0_g1_i1.p1 TRINITY_DN6583_c0_g1~~TRINITY_DN6583_c0_g1_i1.p1  ORF type:complete len:1214 (+),score=376.93 TRINITY_DN6583_c0_g1_i1:263-3904(+)
MASYTSKHGVDDMVMLTKLNEQGILDNLNKRYDNDMIYTYIGHVLISMNPYKMISGLYTDRTLKDYRGKYRYELPPHVYALADDMYRQMLNEGENQCVIISGESGAGKTEASKLIMQYIAAVSGAQAEVQRVKDIILQSNPLLEAFGNAKTVRNNNSSRFGKYMEIQFDLKGDPVGGRVRNYLLEKSRVCYQSPGERNFHVFYQLLAGADQSMRQEWGLGQPPDYTYLEGGGQFTVDGMDDAKELADMRNAMGVIGITPEEQNEVLRLVASVLALGNVHFSANAKDEAEIQNKQALETFAHLFQSDYSSCATSLTSRTISTGTTTGNRVGSIYKCPQTVEGAYYSRDALAKSVYSRLFDWIVRRLNEGLYFNDPDAFTLGVLDIYGFEIFGKNGFEQMCINYVNEKLQQIFIQLTLKAEQEEYAAEGIAWENIDYFNNKICCDLIESKNPMGILTLLDDVCNFPKGDDYKFADKMAAQFATHDHFAGGGGNEFQIRHYAGDVTYCVEGFCDKNKDVLVNDLISLCQCTNSFLLPILFSESATLDNKKRPTTAGFKIKNSIAELVKTLSLCQPHYIRCIKPTERKRPNDFDAKLTMHQVRYLGLLENVRIRRAGYAYRQLFDKFFYRYRVVCPKCWPTWSGDIQSGCDAIMETMHVTLGEAYQKGRTKIFIRAPETVFSLEELRERTVYKYAVRIQRFFAKFALRRYYWEIQRASAEQFKGTKERRRNSIERHYRGDYISYRENFPLKAVVNRDGAQKVVFADNVSKYDRRSRLQRRILVLTSEAVFILAVEKNPSKEERRSKPWVYVLKRRIQFQAIRGVQFSTKQDNFFLLQVNGDYDNLLECIRKTEFIGTLLKVHPGVSVSLQDQFSVTLKKNKSRSVAAVIDPSAGGGRIKGNKISVSSGLPANTEPNLPEPPKVEVQEAKPFGERGIIQRKKQAGAGGGGGFAQPAPTSAGGQGNAHPSPRGVSPAPRTASPSPRGASPFGRGGPPPSNVNANLNNSRGGGMRGRGRGGAPAPNPRGGGGYGGGAPRGRGGPAPRARGGAPRGGSFNRGGGNNSLNRGGAPGRGARGGGMPVARGRGAPPRGGGGQRGRGGGSGAIGGGRGRGRGGPPPRGGRGGYGGAAPRSATPPKPQCKALYDFDAENPDELDFKEGSIIVILDKADQDWWKGALNGKQGIFPKTYVQEIAPPAGRGGGRGRGLPAVPGRGRGHF